MFRVTTNNTKLRVCFAHTAEIKKHRRLTVCRIFDDQTRAEMAMSISICSMNDQFSKAVGRKQALERAAKRLYPADKAARAAIWDAYKASPDGKLQ